MTDVIAMSQTCSNCGATVVNDDPAIKHPVEFLDALRARGWFIPESPTGLKPHRCPQCHSSSA